MDNTKQTTLFSIQNLDNGEIKFFNHARKALIFKNKSQDTRWHPHIAEVRITEVIEEIY